MEQRKIEPMTCSACKETAETGLFTQEGKQLRRGLFAVCSTCGTINVIGDTLQLEVCPEYYLDAIQRCIPEAYARITYVRQLVLERNAKETRH